MCLVRSEKKAVRVYIEGVEKIFAMTKKIYAFRNTNYIDVYMTYNWLLFQSNANMAHEQMILKWTQILYLVKICAAAYCQL